MHIAFSASLDLTGTSISATATSNTGDVSEFAACRAYNCDVIFRHDFDKATGESVRCRDDPDPRNSNESK